MSRAFDLACVALASVAGWAAVGVGIAGDLWLAECLVLAALFFLLVVVAEHWSDASSVAADDNEAL
jgi:hypothetical protein